MVWFGIHKGPLVIVDLDWFGMVWFGILKGPNQSCSWSLGIHKGPIIIDLDRIGLKTNEASRWVDIYSHPCVQIKAFPEQSLGTFLLYGNTT